MHNQQQPRNTNPQNAPETASFAEDQRILQAEEHEAKRQAIRENARRVFRDSGIAEMLQAINKDELRRRGAFEEYDSFVLLRWGSGHTRRHLWIEAQGNTIRFRFLPHRKCNKPAPLCDGEYHTFTSAMWINRDLLWGELLQYYRKPVAESSDD